MSRLQKKCFLASMGMHTTLVLVLVFGAAFLTPKDIKNPMRTITMVPSKLVDSVVNGGGGTPPPPAVAPPAEVPRVAEAVAPPPPPAVEPPKPAVVTPPAPVPPAPAVEPVAVRPPPVESKRPPKAIDRTASKKAVKEAKAKATPVETTPPPKTTAKAPETKSAPKVDLTKAKVVARNGKEVEARAEQERREQQAAADRAAAAAAKRRADQIAGVTGALSNLKDNLSSGISIEPVGGDGAAYANYGQVVVSVYENAWVVPQDITDDNVIVQVTVTIARDGTVVRASVARASTNSTVNKSVKRTLDGVKFVAPFPAGAKDAERTFNIDFNLKAKRLRG